MTFKYIAITGRIDNLDSLHAARNLGSSMWHAIEAEYQLANAAPALRLALLACVDAHDQRSKDVGLRHEDPPHIAAARQLLNSL
jgi:hypothetical protein